MEQNQSWEDWKEELARKMAEYGWENKKAAKDYIQEDESRMIGSLCQPLEIFEKIRQSEVVWIEESVEARAQRILNEYLKEPLTQNASQKVYLKMKKAIQAISKKLGSEKANKLSLFLDECEMEYLRTGSLEKNLDWISDLLRNYYDPFYLNSLNKRQVKVVFRGNHIDCRDFILQSNH